MMMQLVGNLPTQWVAVRLYPQTSSEGAAGYNQSPMSAPVDQQSQARQQQEGGEPVKVYFGCWKLQVPRSSATRSTRTR
jgi:hypothetical protein